MMVPTSQRLETIGRVLWVPAILCALLWVVYMLAQFALSAEYQGIALNMLITAVLVLGLQVFSGNSGILSFGHISFMAIGAYVSALLTIPPAIKKATFVDMPGFLHWILTAELGTLESTVIAGACAAVFALIVATPIVRLRGVPAGIATLALLVIVYTFNVQTTSITRGTSTMIGVPSTTTITSALVWASIAVVIAFGYQASRRGVRLRASRENEAAARSVGVNIPFERGVAWVLSAFMMGVGGALYGHYIIAFSAGEFYFAATFTIVLMLVIGGVTSVSAAVVGTIFITVVQEVLRRLENGPLNGDYPGFTELILAAILLLVLIWRPRGLTAGHEIPWPGDWEIRSWLHPRRRQMAPGLAAQSAVDEQSIGEASTPSAATATTPVPGPPVDRSS
jgi:branched-chain amino acid transport system permease protein